MSDWTVLRHGGRGKDSWRIVAHGDETSMRDRFLIEREKMRQGGVILRGPDGDKIEAQARAPRVRTRW